MFPVSAKHMYKRFTAPARHKSTVERQWLEHLRDHGNMFETGVVRASES